MQIVCPHCAASYLVAETAMGGGRMVRCTNCGHLWLAVCRERPASCGLTAQPAVQTEAALAGANDQAALPVSGAKAALPVPGESTENFPVGEAAGVSGDAAGEAPPLVPESGAVVISDAVAAGAVTATSSSFGAVTIIDSEPGEDNAFVRQRAARRRRVRRSGKRGSNWPTAILTLMVIIAAILAFRTEVVRAMPQTAALFARIGLPVNLRGLEFQQVQVGTVQADGAATLVVEGKVVNVTGRLLALPRLRFALRDPTGSEVYHWTALPQRQTLGPGEAVAFSTRMASPPVSGRDIEIRFFSRNDR